MKPLIKKLVREELNEISAKSAILTSLMTLGSYGGMKGQTTEPTTTNTIQQQVSTPETIKSEWVDSLTNNQAFGEGKSPDLNFAIELANKNALKSLSKKNKTNNLKNVTKIKGKQFKNSDGYYTAFIVIELENSNDQELEEAILKPLAASIAMALGTLGAQGQTTEPTQTTPTTTQTTPTTQTPKIVRKSMYGTPEQREIAAKKREQNRIKIFDNFLKGAYYTEGCVEEVSNEEYSSGCKIGDSEALSYIKGTALEIPKIIYRELKDGTKVKINLKKYQKIIKNQNKLDDVPLDNLNTSKDLKNLEKRTNIDGPNILSKLNPFKVNHCIYSDEDKSGVSKD